MNYKKRNKKYLNKIKKQVINNIAFIAAITIVIVFALIISEQNSLTKSTSNRGLKLLNKYEYPTYLEESGNCMRPYSVGDGVVTFGAGITYPDELTGINEINQLLDKTYSLADNCIKSKDLNELFEIKIEYYENKLVNFQLENDIVFSQKQYDGLLLLVYNSPNILKDSNFTSVLLDKQANSDMYINAANEYYKQFSAYSESFGNGWYNRIVDSSQVYYQREYKFQN